MQAWNYRVWLTDTLRPSQYGVGQMNTLSVFFMTEQEVGWTMELLLSVQHQHTAVRKVGSLTSVETEIWAAWLKQVDQFSKALRNTVLYTRSTQGIGEHGIELLSPLICVIYTYVLNMVGDPGTLCLTSCLLPRCEKPNRANMPRRTRPCPDVLHVSWGDVG